MTEAAPRCGLVLCKGPPLRRGASLNERIDVARERAAVYRKMARPGNETCEEAAYLELLAATYESIVAKLKAARLEAARLEVKKGQTC